MCTYEHIMSSKQWTDPIWTIRLSWHSWVHPRSGEEHHMKLGLRMVILIQRVTQPHSQALPIFESQRWVGPGNMARCLLRDAYTARTRTRMPHAAYPGFMACSLVNSSNLHTAHSGFTACSLVISSNLQ